MRYIALRRHGRVWVGLLALFGIAVGHVLAYVLAERDPVARAQVLASSGHGYWRIVLVAAVGSGIAGLATFVVAAWRPGSGRASGAATLFRFSLLRLAVLQVSGFLLLEGVERALAGGDLAHLVIEPAVILGVALQIAVAVAMASLLPVVARVVEALATARSFHPFRAEASPQPSRFRASLRLLEVGAGGATLRGPPELPP